MRKFNRLSLLGTILLFALGCHQNVQINKTDGEIFKVEKTYYLQFVNDYTNFIKSLDVKTNIELANFINQKEILLKNKKASEIIMRKDNVVCNCTPGQATCSASSYFSECCICWNPNSQTGACGTYFGVASCQAWNNNPDERSEYVPSYISFNKRNFSEMIDFASSKGVDVSSVLNSLSTLEANAVKQYYCKYTN